jgi:hypothetical protein
MAVVVRALAAVVGVAILGFVVDAAIAAAGGYSAPSARLMMGLAAGVAVASLAVGLAWEAERRGLALCLVACLVAGEAWALLQTAERTIAHREQQQAPLRSAAETRTKLAERVKAAEVGLAGIPATPRLEKAEAAKKAADEAVVAKAAEKGCAKNCKDLLQAQVDAATVEVAAARTQVDAMRAAAEGMLKQARAELAALPIPPSATPLADRLGISGYSLDIIQAMLASLAANGLASFLLAFAAHGWKPYRPAVIDITPEPVAEVAPTAPAPDEAGTSLQSMTPPARDAKAEADAFARSTFRPSKRGRVVLKEIPAAYEAWCQKHGLAPLPTAEIGVALAGLFSSAGLYRRGVGARAAIPGIEWSRQEPLRIEGP